MALSLFTETILEKRETDDHRSFLSLPQQHRYRQQQTQPIRQPTRSSPIPMTTSMGRPNGRVISDIDRSEDTRSTGVEGGGVEGSGGGSGGAGGGNGGRGGLGVIV